MNQLLVTLMQLDTPSDDTSKKKPELQTLIDTTNWNLHVQSLQNHKTGRIEKLKNQY